MPAEANQSQRLVSLDAFRGATMLFMATEMLHLPAAIKKVFTATHSSALRFLLQHLEHVVWSGCAAWDLIQPAFMFTVGVALPFSIAARQARGHSFRRICAHALWRSFVLVALGIFLRSIGKPQTNFTFEDVLTQIGLGYPFLFLLGFVRPRWQWAAAIAVLVGYWAAFALYPAPTPDFDYRRVGVINDGAEQFPIGDFRSHWSKNSNLAAGADEWFLNLFPRETSFVFNRGGYQTLNFVPSLATMIFGLLAGGWLRAPGRPATKASALFAAGLLGAVLGWALAEFEVCPMVKRIWTPSWALYSAGLVTMLLAGFYLVIDGWDRKRWAFPFVVVGANSIAMYLLVHVAHDFTAENLRVHLGHGAFELFGQTFVPVVEGATVLAIFWLILWWMYRRQIFLRV